jgi:RNA polymerase sigma factor (sigma-70 family)
MSNSSAVVAAGSEVAPTTALTDAQLSAFWDGILANTDAARRMARQIVPKQDVDDVVNSASILFLESLQRPDKPAKFPADNAAFLHRFVAIIRNHALDCVRDSGAAAERPVRTNWGVESEPAVGGRKIADRPLDHVFARNDMGNYDAAAETPMRPKDNIDALDSILRAQVGRLPTMQRKVIVETFFNEQKRAQVAAKLGISVKTYDNHLQAAFNTLRDELWYDAFDAAEIDRSAWFDRIEQLSDRYDYALGLRIAREMGITIPDPRKSSTNDGPGGTTSRAGAA